MTNDFEIKRRALLAALYRMDDPEAERIYTSVWECLQDVSELSEIDQKTINQIQRAYKRIAENRTPSRDSRMDDIHRLIRKKMADIAKSQVKNPSYAAYDQWAKQLGLTEQQINVMSETVSSLQITIGCSNYCRRCNEWALAFVRKYFTFDAVTRFLDMLFQNGNTAFSLYNASDPLEWQHQERNIVHITRYMAEKNYTPGFGLLTKIPAGTEKTAETLLKEGVEIGVSITRKNRNKIGVIEQNAGKKFDVQHDVDELEIPAGLDEDFSDIKSSITDNYGTEITPEGAFIIIPTFTSALNPTGQHRIRINADTTFFLEKKVGHATWSVAYFKPLKAIDLSGRTFTLETLLDAQIENILQDSGSEEVTPPGMMTLAEFFKTFEPAAVNRRKKLLKSVVREYQRQILVKEDGNLTQQRKQFRHKVKQYIEFCRMESVNEFKKYAFSYFLNVISGYVKHHPAGKEIVLHLRHQDAVRYRSRFDDTFGQASVQADRIVENCEHDVFGLFQSMMFRLLEHPDDTIIQAFIEKYPAGYDVEADRFIKL